MEEMWKENRINRDAVNVWYAMQAHPKYPYTREYEVKDLLAWYSVSCGRNEKEIQALRKAHAKWLTTLNGLERAILRMWRYNDKKQS